MAAVETWATAEETCATADVTDDETAAPELAAAEAGLLVAAAAGLLADVAAGLLAAAEVLPADEFDGLEVLAELALAAGAVCAGAADDAVEVTAEGGRHHLRRGRLHGAVTTDNRRDRRRRQGAGVRRPGGQQQDGHDSGSQNRALHR